MNIRIILLLFVVLLFSLQLVFQANPNSKIIGCSTGPSRERTNILSTIHRSYLSDTGRLVSSGAFISSHPPITIMMSLNYADVLSLQLEQISAEITKLQSRLSAHEHRVGEIRTPPLWELQPSYQRPHEGPNSSGYNARQNDYDPPPWPDPDPAYNPTATVFHGSAPQYHRQPAYFGSVPPPLYQPEWLPPPQSYQSDRTELLDISLGRPSFRATDRFPNQTCPLNWRHRGPEPYDTLSGQQYRPWSYHLDRPSLPPLPIIKPSSCWGPPEHHDHVGPPQFELHQSPPLSMHRPTCWDPSGQQGYTSCEQPPPIDWPPSQGHPETPLTVAAVPSSMRMEDLGCVTEEERFYGADFVCAHLSKLDGSFDSYVGGKVHEVRDQRGEDSNSLSLVAKNGHLYDIAGDFECFSKCRMVKKEHCDAPERVPSTNSIFKTEAKETIDRNVATSDIGNISNPTIGLPSNINGREEELNKNFSELIEKEIKVEAPGFSLVAKGNNLSMLSKKPNKNGKMESQSLVGEHKVVFEMKEQELEVERQEKRRLFADELRVRTGGLVMKESPIGYTKEILTKRVQPCVFDNFANNVICRVALGSKYGYGEEFVPWLCWIKFVNGISGRVRKVAINIDEFLEFVVKDHIGERQEEEKVFVDVFLDVPSNEMGRGHLHTFDPSGDTSPKLLFATLFVLSWFPSKLLFATLFVLSWFPP